MPPDEPLIRSIFHHKLGFSPSIPHDAELIDCNANQLEPVENDW